MPGETLAVSGYYDGSADDSLSLAVTVNVNCLTGPTEADLRRSA